MADELGVAADRLASLRDLLLPRLVTGAIDVSKVDLDALIEKSAA
jgi:type I restriction enzyme S subunit